MFVCRHFLSETDVPINMVGKYVETNQQILIVYLHLEYTLHLHVWVSVCGEWAL